MRGESLFPLFNTENLETTETRLVIGPLPSHSTLNYNRVLLSDAKRLTPFLELLLHKTSNGTRLHSIYAREQYTVPSLKCRIQYSFVNQFGSTVHRLRCYGLVSELPIIGLRLYSGSYVTISGPGRFLFKTT